MNNSGTQSLLNKALKLYNKREYEKAIKVYKKITEQSLILLDNTSKANIYFNKAISYLAIGKHNQAKKLLLKAREYNSDNNFCRDQLVMCEFGLGNMNEAFAGYKYRYYKPNPGPGEYPKHNFIMDLDTFNNQKNNNIFVNREQGLGDEIMFSLSLEYLSTKVKSCTIKVSQSMLDLFNEIYKYNNISFTSSEPAVEDFTNKYDAWTVLGDVFTYQHLEQSYSPGSIDISNLVPHIQTNTQKPRIGVACYALPTGDNFKEKTISYKEFNKFSNDNDLYCVQKLMPEHYKLNRGCTIPSVIDDDFSFLDTAKILLSMDAIYTIDTSVAHLAGLLGIKTYVIINEYYDWRWKYLNLYENTEVISLSELRNKQSLI